MNNQEQINKDWNTLHDFDELISLLIERLQKRIPHLEGKASQETKNLIEELRKENDARDKDLKQTFLDYQIAHSKEHKELREMFEPVVKTYEGVAFMSTWLGKILVTISVLSGLVWGWFAFLKPFFEKLRGG